MPKQYKREAFGMDFGYTNDPSTMVRIVLAEGKLYAELMLYQRGLTGSDIGEWLKKIKFNKSKYIFTDVAPPTVEEIRRKGFRKTRAAKKGAGSIVTGIDAVKNYGTLHIVDNIHWRAEQIGYKYQENPATGDPTNDPEQNKGVDHIWDALRYAIQGIITKRKI
jgi:phage terminase large subunit